MKKCLHDDKMTANRIGITKMILKRFHIAFELETTLDFTFFRSVFVLVGNLVGPFDPLEQ